MKIIAFVVIYLAGGVALFPYLDHMRPVGISLDQFYSEFYLGSGVDVAQRLSVSFIYASAFHLVWSALFSESAKSWVYTTNITDICYLALRCLSSFCISLMSLGLVGKSTQKAPYTDFHQYFTFLVICMLAGAWAWGLKDFLIAAIYYTARKITRTAK
ncbi:hypothetical protein [Pseudomonas kribbensis]|uniref:hypothetical protein n=1 Tax=Pseudomonas kribbensis TaxID=1628086 RepID=UPI001F3453D4|nr:hypothetical protein [Pseudomonas kribbensis]UIN54156.1 hypothetical protein LXN51_24965 [Pseudomonas kribbensis]